MKRCPKCKDNKVVMSDSYVDFCPKCKEWFSTVAEEEDVCETGCRYFHGGEVRHHPDCIFYPESFTKMYDDLRIEHERFENDIKRIMVEINTEILKNVDAPNLGKEGCIKRLKQLLTNDYIKDPEELDILTEIAVLRKALKNMHFAYINKDADIPHQFETDAIQQYEALFPEETSEQESPTTIGWYKAQAQELFDIRKAFHRICGDTANGADA